jgi:signal transduction histidine kinase/sugar lactone lactonase YvrE
VVGLLVVAAVMSFSIQSVFAAQGIRPVATAPDSSEYDFSPRLIARDGSTILIGDPFGSNLRRYNLSGQLVGTITLDNVSANSMAVSPAGDIYLTDSNTMTVKKYSSSGTLLNEFGSSGTGNGQFTAMSGIALDSLGNIFVGDDGYSSGSSHRIQKFDSNGNFITKWGTYGSGNGQFNRPSGIAVDVNNGNTVFVTDLMNHRVQKFDNNGTYLTKWGSQGSGNGQFSYPYGITIDSGSNVYVVDALNYRVQKFDNNGTYLTKWGSQGSGNGQFNSISISALTTDLSGNVFYADYGNLRVQQFTNVGVFLKQFAEFPVLGTQRGVEVDAAGNVYVADSGNKRIVKYDPQRRFLAKWSVPTTFQITGLAIDSQNRILVLIYSTVPEVLVYDSNGTLLNRWGSEGAGDGQFSLSHWVESANGIAVDGNGNVFVSDTGNHRIQKFDQDGNFITKWGSFSDAMGGFKYPRDIDVDSSGAVYVLDTWYLNRIQKFDTNGNLISYTLGSALGIYGGQSENMAIGPDDTMYVTNDYDHNVKILRYETWLSISTVNLPYVSYGDTYSASIEVDDPAGPVSYSIIAGNLPAGLSLDSTTGEISGEPEGTEYRYDYFTIRATDGVTTADREFVIGTEEARYIKLQDQNFSEATKNESYLAQIFAGPIHGTALFSLTSGVLPAGLSLNGGTGQITGTPTTSGSYTFTVSVQDKTGQDSRQYTLQVGPLEADISVETVLGSPGLSPGQQSQYTITYTNTGPDVLPPNDSKAGVYSLILIPNELTRVSVSTPSDTTCFPYPAPYPAGLSQYQSQGELLYCARSNTSVSLGLNETRSIVITVQSSAQVTEDTTMKVASFGLADPDQQVFNTVFNNYQDVYSLNSNSVCNYKGMTPGSCLDDAPPVEISPDALPNAKYSGDMYDVQLDLLNAPQGIPTRFSVVDGEFPKGLTLSDGVAGGRIYGDPFSAGTWTFTIRAERSPDYTSYPYYSATKTYTLTVDPADLPPSFSSFSSPLVTLNSVTRINGDGGAQLSGNGPAGQLVEVYMDGSHIGGARVSGAGVWSYLVNGISKSEHRFDAKWEPQQDIAFTAAVDTTVAQSKLLLLDSADKSLIKKVDLPSGFFAFESQINHSGTKVYVSGAYTSAAVTRVIEYDIASGRFTSMGDFASWQGLSKSTISNDDATLYVLGDTKLYVVDIATKTSRVINMSSMHDNGDQRYSLLYGNFAVNDTKTKIFVATSNFEGSLDFRKMITEVDLQTNVVTARSYGTGRLKERFDTIISANGKLYAIYGNGTGLVLDQDTGATIRTFNFGLDSVRDFNNNYAKEESAYSVSYNSLSNALYAFVYSEEGDYYLYSNVVKSYSLKVLSLADDTINEFPATTTTFASSFNSQNTELLSFATDPDYQSGAAWFYSFNVSNNTFSEVKDYPGLMPYMLGGRNFVGRIVPPQDEATLAAAPNTNGPSAVTKPDEPGGSAPSVTNPEVAEGTGGSVDATTPTPVSPRPEVQAPRPLQVIAPTQARSQNPESINGIQEAVLGISKVLGVSPRVVVVVFPWLAMLLLAILSFVILYKVVRQLFIIKHIRALVSRQELLNHEKKSLLSLVSHYLRTPLTILAAGADTLPADSAERAVVEPAVSHLKSVVDSIISKIEGDQGLSVLWKPDQPIQKRARLFQVKLLAPLAAVALLVVGLNVVAIYGAKINPGLAQMLAQGLGFLILGSILYTVYDVRAQKSQTKQYEAKLLSYEESLDHARNQFIKDVSNDLVPAVIELDSALPPVIPETSDKYLKEGLRQLEHTIENFILVSQLEKNRLRQKATEFKVLTSIENARKNLEDPDVPVNVTISNASSMKQPEFLLRKVLSSLMSNAVEHSGADSATEITSGKQGDHIKIDVKDQGEGIDPKKLSLLFKPLSRVEEAEDFTHQGMGLSLYVNRLVMHYMGGEITAQSRLGSGTTMSLNVPVELA